MNIIGGESVPPPLFVLILYRADFYAIYLFEEEYRDGISKTFAIVYSVVVVRETLFFSIRLIVFGDSPARSARIRAGSLRSFRDPL